MSFLTIISFLVFPYFMGWLISRAIEWISPTKPIYIPFFALGFIPIYFLFLLYQHQYVSVPIAQNIIFYSFFLIGGPLLFNYRRELPPLILNPVTLIFLSLLFFLVYIGAYLEIPSDPLAHLYKIYYGEYRIKVSYFYYHLALTYSPKDSLLKYDLWQAITILMLAFEFFRIGFIITQSRAKAFFILLSTFAFFGTNIFSYFRYYNFSTGFLAYIFYLNALLVLLNLYFNRKALYLLLLPLLFYLAAKIHLQEAMYIAIAFSISPFLWYLIYDRRSLAYFYRLKSTWFLTGVTVVALIERFFFFKNNLIKYTIKPNQFVTVWSPDTAGFKVVFPINFSHLHTSPVHLTLGLPGYISILFTLWILFSKKFSKPEKAIATVSISFFIMLFFPPTTYLLSIVLRSPYLFYRVLYGSLYWFPLAIGIYKISALLYRHFVLIHGFSWSRYLKPIPIALIMFVGFIYDANTYGRLYHFIHRVPYWYDVRAYYGAIRHIIDTDWQDRLKKGRCRVLSDASGNMALMSFSNIKYEGSRFNRPPKLLSQLIKNPHLFIKGMNDKAYCLIAVRKSVVIPVSWVGSTSRHWLGHHALPNHNVPQHNLNLFLHEKSFFKKVYEDEFVYLFSVNKES